MPELPEVETVRRGIETPLAGRCITQVIVRDPRLRWPVDPELPEFCQNARVESVQRRAKYLLINTSRGVLMVHLGMSGRLYFVDTETPAGIHDHIDWQLDNGKSLRYTDPRRFGSVHWLQEHKHPLLDHLGPEPLTGAFNGELLYLRSRKRKASIKTFIMDGRIVVGVGNIYANEALFRSGIHPATAAGKVSKVRYETLAHHIKQVLSDAIAQGGTTLKDFVNGDGQPGYFKQELSVYGRAGKACLQCDSILREIRLGQRSTVFCPHCQKR